MFAGTWRVDKSGPACSHLRPMELIIKLWSGKDKTAYG
jgi:hypothetical protein